MKVLATFDGMHLRNSLVVAAAMQKASGLGFKHAVVGDGADELFGGYSFMWGNADDPAQWREKRDKMCSQWTFATSALAGMYGMDAHRHGQTRSSQQQHSSDRADNLRPEAHPSLNRSR